MNRNLLIIVAATFAAACGSANAELQLEGLLEEFGAEEDAKRVEVVEVRPSAARIELDLPGEIQGFEDVRLASALGGFVEDVRVKEGQEVAKGEVLVVVDRGTYAAQLDQAEAQLDQAKLDLQRYERLGDMGSDAQVAQLRTQVRVAEAQVKLAKTQLGRATIRAPFAGVVADLGIHTGEVASPATPVLRLIQLDPVKVSLSVSDRDVVALHPGMEARVTTAALGKSVVGKVARVSPVANLSTRSFMVEVEVDNPNRRLLPGMIARVFVEREIASEAVVLPQEWVVTRLEGYGVFVADADGIARWRPVTLGDVVRGQVVVTDGVQPGERVVMTGQHGLVDGDPLIVAREGFCCRDGRPVF